MGYYLLFFTIMFCLGGCDQIAGLIGLKKSAANGWINEDYIELHENFLSKNPNSSSSKYLTTLRKNCEAESVRSITYKGNNKKFFFEILGGIKGQDRSDQAYILYLPDDIASPSIGRKAIKGFNTIQADHLGVGCNYMTQENSSFKEISTIESAKRYVQILKAIILSTGVPMGASWEQFLLTLLKKSQTLPLQRLLS